MPKAPTSAARCHLFAGKAREPDGTLSPSPGSQTLSLHEGAPEGDLQINLFVLAHPNIRQPADAPV